jgi:hypothetical protein
VSQANHDPDFDLAEESSSGGFDSVAQGGNSGLEVQKYIKVQKWFEVCGSSSKYVEVTSSKVHIMQNSSKFFFLLVYMPFDRA